MFVCPVFYVEPALQGARLSWHSGTMTYRESRIVGTSPHASFPFLGSRGISCRLRGTL